MSYGRSVILIRVAWPFAAGLAIIAVVGLAKWLHGRYKIVRRRPATRRTAWWDDTDPDIGFTYHIMDANNGDLLYVGSSIRSPFARLAEHVQKDWWPRHYDVRMFKHANYGSAHVAEIEAIRTLVPRHNKIRYFKSAPPAHFNPQSRPLWSESLKGGRESNGDAT
ncbi:hypothetical protein [Fodinicola feengrottensis]|uniref:hypothetical protein n=1 Tax=Fodinicola feengrottensis TaxID=435914 RepID=UPI002441C6C4|nr:hypothetical protein [Fodinicola feengrottensis]